jgi:hypothetical protein
MKIRPVGGELFHAGTRTDIRVHDEANSLSSQFCERGMDVSSHCVLLLCIGHDQTPVC